MRRANKNNKRKLIKLEDDHKIYWMDNPIAYILKRKRLFKSKIRTYS